jgi:dihydroxyacetone kinase-like predicted kinase
MNDSESELIKKQTEIIKKLTIADLERANAYAKDLGRGLQVVRSFPQGVTCLLNFSEDAEVEENTQAMTEAIDTVTTISITYAVHDSDINGLGIKKGQMLGLLNGEVVVAKDKSISLIDHFAPQIENASYITLYTGKDSDSKSAAAILSKIKAYAPDAEVVEIDGDQDVYSYIISLE